MIPSMSKEVLAPVFPASDMGKALAWYERLGFTLELEYEAGSQTTAVVKRGDLSLVLVRGDRALAAGLVYMKVQDLSALTSAFDVPLQKTMFEQLLELSDPDGNRVRVVTMDPKAFAAIVGAKGRLTT